MCCQVCEDVMHAVRAIVSCEACAAALVFDDAGFLQGLAALVWRGLAKNRGGTPGEGSDADSSVEGGQGGAQTVSASGNGSGSGHGGDRGGVRAIGGLRGYEADVLSAQAVACGALAHLCEFECVRWVLGGS